MKRLRRKYQYLLAKLARRELRAIADSYPEMTLADVTNYHDYMALNCLNRETQNGDRIMGVSLKTAEFLDLYRETPNYKTRI